MSVNKQKIWVDASIGGYGEIWMRIIGFYTVAGLRPEFEIGLLIPEFLNELCVITFGDRLKFLSREDKKDIKYEFTNFGLRHLLPGIIKGKRYISPIQRTAIRDKKNKNYVKNTLNDWASIAMDFIGLVHIPKIKWSSTYHGFLEMVSIKQFRFMDYESFVEQTKRDYTRIHEKLNGNIPLSPELVIPSDLNDNVLVFPTGTSRQFMPVEWAKKYLPDAYYAFFHKSGSLPIFKEHGLKTVSYYKEAGDMIALSKHAKWTVVTDSFHSHVIQSANEKCTVLITELIKERVVNPSFRGKVVDAEVPCHPCIHMTGSPVCAAGYTKCLNWDHAVYTSNVISSTLKQ